ncbi:acyl carrier protein [Aquihabitans sp. G128]|uniref:acyl carrier protein n=1 Tax=Aquihabitans sp. G128 TaxID=2849779 RepID=UPI001C23774F|nr:acyl carrier protein [Aquihabitans sp. G128]QXC59427.1 acyl carrier protein [Aquihabitans sp. G128]
MTDVDTTAPDAASVLAELERILTEVIGDDLLLDEPLSMATSFDEDLQLESIEFVALAEKLLDTYGERVDFVTWMAGMELDEIIALTVGQVVDFVVASLSGPAPAAGSPAEG